MNAVRLGQDHAALDGVLTTLAAVYRETKAWRWPAFLFTYMTLLAWVASFAVYQGGRALGLG